jgi:hypothetical protein
MNESKIRVFVVEEFSQARLEIDKKIVGVYRNFGHAWKCVENLVRKVYPQIMNSSDWEFNPIQPQHDESDDFIIHHPTQITLSSFLDGSNIDGIYGNFNKDFMHLSVSIENYSDGNMHMQIDNTNAGIWYYNQLITSAIILALLYPERI